MKTCTSCKLEKNTTDFYRAKAFNDGLSYKCKVCSREYQRQNKEKYNALQLAYHYRNREKILAKRRAEWVHSYNRIPSTPESVAVSRKKWKDKNKHKVNEYAMRRRAIMLNRILPNTDMNAIIAIYKEAKERRNAGEDVHVDHIIPLMGKEMQGWHCAENLRIIPAHENLSKGNKIVKELVESIIIKLSRNQLTLNN